MNIVSTNKTNNIVTSVSLYPDDKKVRYKIDCHILHTVLLMILLL